MREWIKSYHVFLSGRLRKIVAYLILPIFLLGIGYAFKMAMGESIAGVSVLSTLIVTLEIFLDYFVFGGIASKDTNKLEYLKTSIKGMDVLKRSLIVDVIRRFVGLGIVVFGMKYICGYEYSNGQAFVWTICYFMLSELALAVTRHFSFLSLVGAGGMIISFAAPVATMLFLEENINVLVAGIILMIIGICIAAGSRVLIMKKARGSYYDERS